MKLKNRIQDFTITKLSKKERGFRFKANAYHKSYNKCFTYIDLWFICIACNWYK
jgi:hypothetical protein